jgi:hypothetical protein
MLADHSSALDLVSVLRAKMGAPEDPSELMNRFVYLSTVSSNLRKRSLASVTTGSTF